MHAPGVLNQNALLVGAPSFVFSSQHDQNHVYACGLIVVFWNVFSCYLLQYSEALEYVIYPMHFKRTTFPVGPFQCNCSLIWDPETKDALLIDPGDEAVKITKKITELGLTVRNIIHTHAHFDHVGASLELHESTKAKLLLHPGDRFLWENLPMQGQFFGFNLKALPPWSEDLHDEEELEFGKFKLKTLHTPGHTPGSCSFVVDDILFSGDTLFLNSIGRTDLWGGDSQLIQSSIRDRLYSLDPDTHVICGHGPDTKIGTERRTNPFVSI